MRELIITSILQGLDQKKTLFEGWSWFRFNNLGLVLDITMKFNISVVKGQNVKGKEILGLALTFVENTAK